MNWPGTDARRRPQDEDVAARLPVEARGRDEVEKALGRLLKSGPATAVVVIPERLHELVAVVGGPRSRELAATLESRLSQVAGPTAVVGRTATYEFAVALPGSPDDPGVNVGALLDALEVPIEVDGFAYPVRPLAGISCGPADGSVGEVLLARAEVALHRGQGRERRFDLAMERDARHRLSVLSDLERALATGQLHLHFQPIIDLQTGGVDGVEALVRWDHPQHGSVPPAAFIPLAEQTGLIGPLTEHVLGLALDHSAAWRADGLRLPVAVNLSARNVTDADLPDRVAAMLAERALDGDALRLEITESVLMEHPAVAVHTLERLRDLGLSVALDDFGTGYSSLAYLRDLPLDELKIDSSFVRVLGESPQSAAVLRAVSVLAGDLGLRTIAEGVEDAATVALVGDLGCSLAQGFYFARPLAPAGLRLWLDHRLPPLPAVVRHAA